LEPELDSEQGLGFRIGLGIFEKTNKD